MNTKLFQFDPTTNMIIVTENNHELISRIVFHQLEDGVVDYVKMVITFINGKIMTYTITVDGSTYPSRDNSKVFINTNITFGHQTLHRSFTRSHELDIEQYINITHDHLYDVMSYSKFKEFMNEHYQNQ